MYAKIYEQIFSSSIMEEPVEVRYIWLCLLTLADKEGFVDMTIPAIARRINISEDHVASAIEKFMLPDSSSRTATKDGKRLEQIRDSFGWKIINYEYYRSLRDEDKRRQQNRDAQRRYRQRQRKVSKRKCSKPPSAHTDTDTDTDTDTKEEGSILLAAKKLRELPAKLNTEEFRKIWDEWQKYRAESRHKLTLSTIEKQLEKLEAYPVEVAVKMLEQSIVNGWQGIFEVKNDNVHRRTITGENSDQRTGHQDRGRNYADQESAYGKIIDV